MDENNSDVETTESPARGPRVGQKQISTNDLPRNSLEECLEVARPIHETYAGGLTSWDELASAMGVGANSASTKYLIWGAQAYELIVKEGKKYRLSETGRKILSPNYPEERQEGLVKAIRIPTVLSRFYSDYDGKLLPEDDFFPNVLENRYSVPRNRVQEAKGIILANAEYAGIVMTHSTGKKTIRLEGAQEAGRTSKDQQPVEQKRTPTNKQLSEPNATEVTDVHIDPTLGQSLCFYITPIGDEGSTERKHSDMLLKHLVEPAFGEFKIGVVRADKIGKSGLISQQIFEHIVSSKFCVADLSFGNPNAFYELGVRHMTKLPTIQIIRKGDKIPFDVAQGRTIVIDVSDIYTILDRIESARKELVEYIRNYLNPSDTGRAEDNPVSIYLPGLQVKLPRSDN